MLIFQHMHVYNFTDLKKKRDQNNEVGYQSPYGRAECRVLAQNSMCKSSYDGEWSTNTHHPEVIAFRIFVVKSAVDETYMYK